MSTSIERDLVTLMRAVAQNLRGRNLPVADTLIDISWDGTSPTTQVRLQQTIRAGRSVEQDRPVDSDWLDNRELRALLEAVEARTAPLFAAVSGGGNNHCRAPLDREELFRGPDQPGHDLPASLEITTLALGLAGPDLMFGNSAHHPSLMVYWNSGIKWRQFHCRGWLIEHPLVKRLFRRLRECAKTSEYRFCELALEPCVEIPTSAHERLPMIARLRELSIATYGKEPTNLGIFDPASNDRHDEVAARKAAWAALAAHAGPRRR